MIVPRSLQACAAALLLLACQDNPIQPTPEPGNQAPTASLVVRQQGIEGEAAAGFDAAGSTDPDGDSLSYWWDFGDGTTGTEVSPLHTYIDNGTYSVRLIVSDHRGGADTANASVSIRNSPPYIYAFSLSIPQMPAPLPVQAVAHLGFSDRGAADNPVAAIDWGDGTISTDTIHTYTAPGAYAVILTVTDKDGASSTGHTPDRVWVYDRNSPNGTPTGYEFFDLGTLGGSKAIPMSLNNHGEIVGHSTTSDGERHAFLWTDGAIRDIGFPLAGSSAAQRINDAGWIAGAAGEYANNLVVWRDGVLSRSWQVGSGEDNAARAIAVDDVGGVLVNISGHEYGSSALWRNDALIRLGGLHPNGYATSSDINHRGQIVGGSAFRYIGAAHYRYHAFLWKDGVMTDLGDLGYGCDAVDPYEHCGSSTANSINERGQIVGAARAPSGLERAAIWEPGSSIPKDLGFGTGRSRAVAINERGEIAGDSDEPGEGFFRDADGVVTSLGSLGGGGTQVVAMNEAGVVVGVSKTAAGDVHAFVWRRATGMVDLGAGPYGARGVGTLPVAINDRGDVVGVATPCTQINPDCHPDFSATARAILWRAQAPAATAFVR